MSERCAFAFACLSVISPISVRPALVRLSHVRRSVLARFVRVRWSAVLAFPLCLVEVRRVLSLSLSRGAWRAVVPVVSAVVAPGGYSGRACADASEVSAVIVPGRVSDGQEFTRIISAAIPRQSGRPAVVRGVALEHAGKKQYKHNTHMRSGTAPRLLLGSIGQNNGQQCRLALCSLSRRKTPASCMAGRCGTGGDIRPAAGQCHSHASHKPEEQGPQWARAGRPKLQRSVGCSGAGRGPSVSHSSQFTIPIQFSSAAVARGRDMSGDRAFSACRGDLSGFAFPSLCCCRDGAPLHARAESAQLHIPALHWTGGFCESRAAFGGLMDPNLIPKPNSHHRERKPQKRRGAAVGVFARWLVFVQG